jgi:hypothetical protein
MGKRLAFFMFDLFPFDVLGNTIGRSTLIQRLVEKLIDFKLRRSTHNFFMTNMGRKARGKYAGTSHTVI